MLANWALMLSYNHLTERSIVGCDLSASDWSAYGRYCTMLDWQNAERLVDDVCQW